MWRARPLFLFRFPTNPGINTRVKYDWVKHGTTRRRFTSSAPLQSSNPALSEALQYFQEMKDNGIHPNTITYNTLINAFVKNHEMPLAMTLFREMISSGVPPDDLTYDSMLNQPGDDKHDLSNFFHELGIKPKACFRIHNMLNLGKFNQILPLLDEMETNDPTPDSRTYNVIIDYLVKSQDINNCLLFFHRMKATGKTPDRVIYNAVIGLVQRKGDMNRVIELFQEMQQSGVSPDTITYNSIIDGFSKGLDMVQAEKFFQEMKTKGISPTDFTYSILIRGHTRKNNMEDIQRLMNEMDSHPVPKQEFRPERA